MQGIENDESWVNDFFESDDKSTEETKQPTNENETKEKVEETQTETQEPLTDEDLEKEFEEDLQESVGTEDKENIQESKETQQVAGSPTPYSAFASDLIEDGLFSTLDKKDIPTDLTSEGLRDLVQKQINNSIDIETKRVAKALSAGLPPEEIRQLQTYVKVYDSITDQAITEEGEQGDRLRQNLLYQDAINRGYTESQAKRLVENSFKAGTEIEDAKEALATGKKYYNDQYNNIIKQGEENERKVIEETKKQAEAFQKDIMEGSKPFGDIQLDKQTREKILKVISKPYSKDENGRTITEMQKYQQEHFDDFLKYSGLFYVMTDGFKNLDNLFKSKVQKEVTKKMRNLDALLKGGSGIENNTMGLLGNNFSQTSKHHYGFKDKV